MTKLNNISELMDAEIGILKFSSEWCQPCKNLQQTLESIDVPVFDADVEEEEDLAREYKVRNLPTMIFFKKGQQKDRKVGNLEKSEIESILKSI